MGRPVVLVVSTTFVGLVFAALVLQKRSEHETPSSNIMRVTAAADGDVKNTIGYLSETSNRTIQKPIDYSSLFHKSSDYWSYAQAVLPAAKSGNRDAQFYLSKALRFCREVNAAYFQKDGRNLGIDEGLQLAGQIGLPVETAQSMFDRCHNFQDQDASAFGNSTDWLASATKARQPAAQATTVYDMLMQQKIKSLAAAGANDAAQNVLPPIIAEKDIHQLVNEAAASQDPEALFLIATALPLLNPSSQTINTDRLAMMLVACERGYDCSSESDWVRNVCWGRCDTSSPVNLVRGFAGDGWPEVQQRAEEISASLNSSNFDDLGLGG